MVWPIWPGTPQQQICGGKYKHGQKRSCDHSADHRRDDSAHHFGASPSADQDREQTGQENRHGHRLGPHSQQGAFADGGRDFLCICILAAPVQRGFQVDQHDDAEFRRHTGQRNKADSGCDGLVVPHQVKQPEATGQREWQRAHDEQRLVEPAEDQIEQQKYDCERRRDDNLQAFIGTCEIFELPGIGQADTRWQIDFCGDDFLQIANHRGKIASAHINVDIACRSALLALEHGRAAGHADSSHGAKRNLLTRRGENRQVTQLVHAVTNFARIPHVDRISRQPLHAAGHVCTADCARYDLLDVGDVEAVAGCFQPVDIDIDIAASR